MKAEVTKAAIEGWKRDGAKGIEMRKYIFAHEWETLCDLALKGLQSARPEALRIDEDAIQQVMWAVFSYADRREAFDKIADGPHSEARDIAREAMRVQDEYIRSLLRKLASVPSPRGRIPCTPCEFINNNEGRCPDCPKREPQGDADK